MRDSLQPPFLPTYNAKVFDTGFLIIIFCSLVYSVWSKEKSALELTEVQGKF